MEEMTHGRDDTWRRFHMEKMTTRPVFPGII
jgi:hypothetical protein